VMAQERTLSTEERRLVRQALSIEEKFDSREEIEQKARRAAELLAASKRAVCFTGAGLSTSAGLGDYRGKKGQCVSLSLGLGSLVADDMRIMCGVWTNDDRYKKCRKEGCSVQGPRRRIFCVLQKEMFQMARL